MCMYNLALNDELVRRTRIAIAAMRHQSEFNGNADMSLDEINFEIQQARKNNPMKTSNTPQEMPFGSESGSVNNVQKKYYTADEAVAFLEPRIRAMFK